MLGALLAGVAVGGGIREGRQASAMVAPAVLSAIVALPLFLRRSRPYLALAGTLILALLAFGLSSPVPPVMLPIAVALYTVGAVAIARWSLIGAAAAIVSILIIRSLFSDSPALAEELVRDVAWIVGSTALGYAVASRRAYVEEFKQRALDAERTREEEAQRRVNEERLRIARDVHDGVAHALASISCRRAPPARSSTPIPKERGKPFARSGGPASPRWPNCGRHSESSDSPLDQARPPLPAWSSSPSWPTSCARVASRCR